MLKITCDPRLEDLRVFRMEGRIVGPWVKELQSVCDAALREESSLTLDLSGVSFVDRQGVVLLRSLIQKGVLLLGSTPFLDEQLHGEGTSRKAGAHPESGEHS